MFIARRSFASVLLFVSAIAGAQTAAPEQPAATGANGPAGTAAAVFPGLPVYPYDITDRPYTVLGEVRAGVRKATLFSKSPSQEKIYRELWERGRKLGADAIINARYGDAHVTAMSWGKTNATGTAIRFNTPAAAPTN